jgi:peptidylprolyl isomerase|tara:strand:+ start:925 stop:1362 length:438 start_codon:yes stop_codon:yes gene_type:complete
MSDTIKSGDEISVHYRGTLEDGTEFENSYERSDPITFTAGEGHMIIGFDNAVIGMVEGEIKTVTFGPEEGYGEVHPERNTELPRSAFPDDFSLEEGKQVPLQSPTGETLMGTITESGDDSVTIDLNHMLAGKTLTFEVEVVKVGS